MTGGLHHGIDLDQLPDTTPEWCFPATHSTGFIHGEIAQVRYGPSPIAPYYRSYWILNVIQKLFEKRRIKQTEESPVTVDRTELLTK